MDKNVNNSFKKSKFYLGFGGTIIILLIIIVLLGAFTRKTYNKNKQCQETLKIEEAMLSLEYSIGYWFINTPEDINDSILYEFLKENGAWYPEILLKQAKLESSNYTSAIYKNNNNLYGMKKVYKRPTTQSGEKRDYGTYNNWCLSVLDRLLWDMFTFKNIKPSKEAYLKAMKTYAKDPNYIKKLQ